MSLGRTQSIARRVEGIFRDGTLIGLPDREVLRRYVDERNPAAFEALLARHGGMVANVCRRILRDPDDASDAFQATFLALACRAGSIRVADSLGPWLYRVASRIAARSRADRRRRGDRERTGGQLPEPASPEVDPSDPDENSRILHEELDRLPERLRAPIVFCYLEGMTHEQAARHLGCPVGTVRSRLARARERLRGRIARRGLAPGLALAGLMATDAGASAVPPAILVSLVKTAAQIADGTASLRGGCGVSVRVAALLEGVLNMFRWKQAAGAASAMAMVGVVVTVAGMAVFAGPGGGDNGPTSRPAADGGRPLVPPGPRTIVKTYYVGDLFIGKPARNAGGDVAHRRWVEISPLVDLITSTVARGTWTVHYGAELGKDADIDRNGMVAPNRKEDVASGKPGSITPFFLTISLIVRHTPEAHEDVARLLRGLREFVKSRDGYLQPEPIRAEEKPARTTPPDSTKRERPDDRNSRIRRLLDELRKEFDEAPADPH